MLQRVQSVYLFLVVVFAVLYCFFPLGWFSVEEVSSAVKLIGKDLSLDNFLATHSTLFRAALMAMAAGVILITLYTIFQFRSRLNQIRLCRMNILLHLALLVTSFFYLDQLKAAAPYQSLGYGPSIFFPLASLFLLLLAIRAIKKDEALVRAADRIR